MAFPSTYRHVKILTIMEAMTVTAVIMLVMTVIKIMTTIMRTRIRTTTKSNEGKKDVDETMMKMDKKVRTQTIVTHDVAGI